MVKLPFVVTGEVAAVEVALVAVLAVVVVMKVVVMLVTLTKLYLSVVDPSPSVPCLFQPVAHRLPSCFTTIVWRSPAATAMTKPRGKGGRGAGGGGSTPWCGHRLKPRPNLKTRTVRDERINEHAQMEERIGERNEGRVMCVCVCVCVCAREGEGQRECECW